MKKRTMFFLGGIIILAAVVVCLGTCLDPVKFVPPAEPINVVISGEVDAWLKDNSVLWVINKSKTVDIRELKISRNDNDPAYPITYPPGDIYGSGAAVPHGTSLASYHQPSPHNPIPWYKVEMTYSTADTVFPDEKPEWWDNSYAIDYGDYPPAGPFHTITVKKQMPRGMDYVILFYKTNDGCLMVADEDTEKHEAHPGDTINNNQIVLPPNGNQLIVAGIINAIISGQVNVTGLDAGLEDIVNEIWNDGQNALKGMEELGTVISNAFDKHAQALLNAFLNHKIEIANDVNVNAGMESLIDYLRERYNHRTEEKTITVYNASSSIIIDNINITQGVFRASTNGNIIGGGDSYNIYLQSPERNFDIVIQYHYIGNSTQYTKTNKIALTGNEYIVFYKQIGDNFAINKTTDMNLLITSADKNDFIVNNDINSVKFNLLNESSAMRIVGLTIKKYRATDTDTMYYKEDLDFVSHGPIGAAGGNDSVIFTTSEAEIESGESYTINIIGDDYRDEVGKGHIIIEVQRPLYIGGAVTLVVTETMVKNAIRRTTPTITYQVTANGGVGGSSSTYNTTMLTFTFENAPLATPTFDYTGDVTTGPLLKTSNPLVYTATCTTEEDKDIWMVCTNEQASNVTSSPHYVRVFKWQASGFTTTRYLFKEAYVENKIVPRNTYHQLKWVLKYDIVNYTNGTETNRSTITKNQYGEWLVDSSTNSGYISFNKTGLLHVGPRPTGAAIVSGNDKAGVAQWELYEGVVFGQTVDGHMIENMPYQSVPLWLGPIQIGSKKVYGLQVTLTIVN